MGAGRIAGRQQQQQHLTIATPLERLPSPACLPWSSCRLLRFFHQLLHQGSHCTHDCVCVCVLPLQATDAWELLTSLLNAGRDGLRADRTLPPEKADAAEELLSVVRGHLTAARLLTKHGLTTPVR